MIQNIRNIQVFKADELSNEDYHGMYLELKRCHSGSISKEQKAFIKRQSELGYFCCVAYGFRSALKAIDDYLTGKV